MDLRQIHAAILARAAFPTKRSIRLWPDADCGLARAPTSRRMISNSFLTASPRGTALA